MSDTYTLLQFIQELLTSVELRDYFAAEPEKALEEYGLSEVSADDVHDALVLLDEDENFADLRDADTADDHVEKPEPAAHESAVEYINRYITNNFVNDGDTTIDNSTNQQIDTGGGDFDQEIDVDSVVASGDGAVAAGGDIEDSTIVSGNDNQVGDGNVSGNGNVVGDGNQAVTGNGNTTSFGSGDATSTNVGGDLTVGDGSAFATGGSASADNSDNSVNDSGNDFSDNSVNDSGNDFSDNSVNDSGNAVVDESVEDSFNDNSSISVADSFNDDSDNSDNSDNSLENVGNIG